ncbi:MAG: hypothetical protein V4526_02310 [Patescibacteria group bacterium]
MPKSKSQDPKKQPVQEDVKPAELEVKDDEKVLDPNLILEVAEEEDDLLEEEEAAAVKAEEEEDELLSPEEINPFGDKWEE